MDVVDKATRSRMMSGIRGKDTRPEIELRRALHALGFRFRLHARALPGKPDIVLPKHRAAILVHGCFWHRHEGCRYTTTPATRPDFWAEKFEGNIERDRRHMLALRQMGWRTAIVWECDLRSSGAAAIGNQLSDWICGAEPQIELPRARSAQG